MAARNPEVRRAPNFVRPFFPHGIFPATLDKLSDRGITSFPESGCKSPPIVVTGKERGPIKRLEIDRDILLASRDRNLFTPNSAYIRLL